MDAMDILTLPGVILLWAFVLIRVRGARYGGSTRLAAILFTLVIAITLRLSFIGQIIDDVTGVTGLQHLVRHACGMLTAVYAALALVEVVGKRPVRPWVSRACRIAVVVAVIGLAIAWNAIGPGRPGISPMGPDSGAPATFTYLAIYTVTYGTFVGVVVVVAARDARRPGPWTPGRRGLALFGIGAAFTDLYLLCKAVGLGAAGLGAYDNPFLVHSGLIQAVPSALAIVFIVAGAASWTQLHLRARRLHRRLREPWAAVTAHVPDVVLVPALRNPEARLNRRVHEIREAATLLVPHLTAADVAALDALPDAVDRTCVLLEVAQLRAAECPGAATAAVSSARIQLPADAAMLDRVLRDRRRARRLARKITQPSTPVKVQ